MLLCFCKAHERQERGVPGRSRFYSSKGQCSWEPCLVLSYNKDTSKDFLIEWVKNGKKKTVKRYAQFYFAVLQM